jgi:hypothetical protein
MTSDIASRPPAGTEQLGGLLSTHRSRFGADLKPFLSILAFVIAVPICGAIAIVNSDPRQRWVGFIIVGLIELFFVAGLIAKGLPKRRPDVLLFTGGFAEVRDDQAVATCRWDEAVSFRELAIRQEVHGIHVETSYNYWVGRRDGHTFGFGDWLEQVQALGDALRERLTPLLLARGRAAWQAGEALDFGPLRLDREWLSRGAERLPLRELEKVEVLNGVLHVRRAGQDKEWFLGVAGEVTNLPVLLDLVDRAAGGGPTLELPVGGRSVVDVGLRCYLCDEARVGNCRHCGRGYCPRHGGWRKAACNACVRKTTDALMLVGVVCLLGAIGLAAWHFVSGAKDSIYLVIAALPGLAAAGCLLPLLLTGAIGFSMRTAREEAELKAKSSH